MAMSPLPERMTTFRMPATRKAVGGLAVAVAVLAAGCGGDAGDGEETQPVPDATVFAEGGFDGLPRYPGAESVSEPAIKDDVTAQSFAVNVARPDRVTDFYAEELEAAGWAAVVAPSQIGADETYRGCGAATSRNSSSAPPSLSPSTTPTPRAPPSTASASARPDPCPGQPWTTS